MNLLQILENDLKALYNENDFAINANYKTATIQILFEDDDEIVNNKEKVISAISIDVSGLSIGDIFNIDSIDYEVFNFNFKDDTEQEMLIAIKKV